MPIGQICLYKYHRFHLFTANKGAALSLLYMRPRSSLKLNKYTHTERNIYTYTRPTSIVHLRRGREQDRERDSDYSSTQPVPMRKQSTPWDRSPPNWGCALNDHAIEWRARHACLPPLLFAAIGGSAFRNPLGYCTALDGSSIAVPLPLNGCPERGKTNQRSASASQRGGECLVRPSVSR